MIELKHMVFPDQTRDTIHRIHRAHANRVFVHAVNERIGGTTVLIDGQERKVRSVQRVTYTSTGEFMIVTLKPLPKQQESKRA
jgi:hypothetical protein